MGRQYFVGSSGKKSESSHHNNFGQKKGGCFRILLAKRICTPLPVNIAAILLFPFRVAMDKAVRSPSVYFLNILGCVSSGSQKMAREMKKPLKLERRRHSIAKRQRILRCFCVLQSSMVSSQPVATIMRTEK